MKDKIIVIIAGYKQLQESFYFSYNLVYWGKDFLLDLQ